MRRLAEKQWVRVLAAVLFFVFLLASCAASAIVLYGRSDEWYRTGKNTDFQDTGGCRAFVFNGLSYVAENVIWTGDLARTDLGSYSGSAFSYVIRDVNGNITADTRTDHSVYVASIERSLTEEQMTDAQESPGRISPASEEYEGTDFAVEGYVNLPVAPYDGCYSEYLMFQTFFSFRYLILALKYIFLALTALMLLILCLGAAARGRKGRLRRFMQLPFDLVLAISAVAFVVVEILLETILSEVLVFSQTYTGVWLNAISWSIDSNLYYGVSILIASGILWYMSGQLGAGILSKNLLLRRLLRRIPDWLAVMVILAVHGILLLMAFNDDFEDVPKLLLLLFDPLVFGLFLLYNKQAGRIRAAADALANGNLSYKTDTKKLRFIWRDLGRELNSISDGMAQAVEDRMRSERMKTELITNVSHDLKTPLTSIINYIDFLSAEGLDEDTRREYLTVLEKQSMRLKKLTEDVVEASKAASGALTVTPEPISMVELLQQFLGEYTERFQGAGITPVLSVPERATVILADSVLLGRVIDNLVTNVLKYAQPGTRAYFDLTADGTDVCLTVKNTSREQLNITADELMERFVRGDTSRHTEGSGLGLAIARSLTELMGGTLKLVLDGDLFKASVVFPQGEANELTPEEESNETKPDAV